MQGRNLCGNLRWVEECGEGRVTEENRRGLARVRLLKNVTVEMCH